MDTAAQFEVTRRARFVLLLHSPLRVNLCVAVAAKLQSGPQLLTANVYGVLRLHQRCSRKRTCDNRLPRQAYPLLPAHYGSSTSLV